MLNVILKLLIFMSSNISV